MSRGLRWLLLGVLVLVILKIVTVGLAAMDLYSEVNRLREFPASAEDFGEAIYDVAGSTGHVAAELQMFAPLLRVAGTDGCALADIIDSVADLSLAGEVLSALAAPAYIVYNQTSENQIDITLLRDRWTEIESSRQVLQDHIDEWDSGEHCVAASGQLRSLQEAIEGLSFLLENFIDVPWDRVLADQTATLIVLNNSDELRATGGFTTAVIVVEIDDGILNWRLLNSYSVDDPQRYAYHPPAPLPQQRYMALSKWTFRDANWSPDHREAARLALQLYALDQQKPRPDNLVTVNFTALQTLMKYVPSLDVDGRVVTSANIMDYVRQAWGFDSSLGSFDPNRKSFLQEVGVNLMSALGNSLSMIEKGRLGLALREMLNRRDVIAYSELPELEDWLERRGWAGALSMSTGDYLMVVDSNLGYNKMSAYTQQAIQYEVNLRREPHASLTLDYHNTVHSDLDCTQYTESRDHVEAEGREPTYYDRAVNCYWNYTRVLIPSGSTIEDYQTWATPPEWLPLTHVQNGAQIDAVEEGPFAGIGTMVVIPVGETRQLRFDYMLPPEVVELQGNQKCYRLWIQKQPGALTADLHVQIVLPDNAVVQTYKPTAGVTIDGNRIIYQRSFDADVSIEIRYE